MFKNKKTIIFDLDGTIYPINKKGFKSTKIYLEIKENSIELIQEILKIQKNKASKIYDYILKKYNTEISIGFEQKLDMNRLEYFRKTWNINPKEYIIKNRQMPELFRKLKKKYNLILLTDAPFVWAKNVLSYLKIYNLFKDNIFTGETDTRKSNYNAFDKVCLKRKINPKDCISVGDQDKTDIIPAKKLGMITIFIGNEKSEFADFSVESILDIKDILEVKIK